MQTFKKEENAITAGKKTQFIMEKKGEIKKYTRKVSQKIQSTTKKQTQNQVDEIDTAKPKWQVKKLKFTTAIEREKMETSERMKSLGARRVHILDLFSYFSIFGIFRTRIDCHAVLPIPRIGTFALAISNLQHTNEKKNQNTEQKQQQLKRCT